MILEEMFCSSFDKKSILLKIEAAGKVINLKYILGY